MARSEKPRKGRARVREFIFRDLPKTLYAKFRHRPVPTRMLVALPRNYSRTGRFPLLVYLHGGDGSAITRKNLAYVRKLTRDRDFIAATMPLFKRALDEKEPHKGIFIGAYDDCRLIAQCYRTMLSALFAAIPNIDPERSAFGGFSNGAHTTALLVSALDPTIMKHFHGFFLLDGGFHIASHHKTFVRNKRIAYFIGGCRRRKCRRDLLNHMDSAFGSGRSPHVTLVKMPGVEHAFPDRYIPHLRRWLYGLNASEPGKRHSQAVPTRHGWSRRRTGRRPQRRR